MANTPFWGLPYPNPDLSSQPNIPVDFQNLAVALENKAPHGKIGYAVRTQQAGPVAAGAGYITVAGLSVSFTLPTARTVFLMFSGQSTSDTAYGINNPSNNQVAYNSTVAGIRIRNVTTGGAKTTTVPILVQNFGHQHFNSVLTFLAAGTYSFAVDLAQFGGPGSAYLTADAAELYAFDMGAA